MLLSQAQTGYLLYMSASGKSPNTTKTYNYILNRLVHDLDNPDVPDITRYDLIEYLANVRNRCKPATVQTHWKVIKSFFKWAKSEFSLDQRPDDDLPCPKVPPPDILPYCEMEIKDLLLAAEYTETAHTHGREPFRMKRSTHLRDTALIFLLLDTGMRIGEATRLRIEDVDYEKTGELHIKAHNDGTKSKPRVLRIGRKSRSALWRYLTSREDPETGEKPEPYDPLLLSSTAFRPYSRDAAKHLISRLGKRAGIPHAHCHRFRHTFAIEFLRNGGDVFSLQYILGHSNLDMCKRYLRLTQTDSYLAHRKASPADNWRI